MIEVKIFTGTSNNIEKIEKEINEWLKDWTLPKQDDEVKIEFVTQSENKVGIIISIWYIVI